MKCPVCRLPMFVAEYDGVELDHCAECNGTWFDRGELALLFTDGDRSDHPIVGPDAIQALPEAEVAEAARRCPLCGYRMRKVNIGPGAGVLVDVCRHGHGIWFDDREVADLASEIESTEDGLSTRALAYLGRNTCGGDSGRTSEGEE